MKTLRFTAAAVIAAASLGLSAPASAIVIAPADNSLLGTWTGDWYYAPQTIVTGPREFSMDIVITGESAQPDGTTALLGHMDFYNGQGVLTQTNGWSTGTLSGFDVLLTNAQNYTYSAFIDVNAMTMLGDWYPTAGLQPPGTDASCSTLDQQTGYCGGFELTHTATTVPEPAGLALLGVGLAGLAIRRRRFASAS